MCIRDRFYTDCVTYFEVNHQSPASVYFQNKIKDLAREVYRMHRSGGKRNKVEISQNVMKTMEKEDIYERIGREMERAKKDQKTID